MSAVAQRSDFIEEHRNTPVGMAFFDSLESVRAEIGLIGFWSAIERAWQLLNLDGVLFLDGRPILYLKEYRRPISSPERIRLQRLFWNQGVANILVLADPTSVFIYSGLAKPLHDSSDDEAIKAVLVDTMSKAAYALQVQTFYRSLTTGYYYEKKRNYFDPDQSVDRWLLDNLRALRDELIKDDEEGRKLDIKDAHAFIGRVLFLCYLLDRGIVTIGDLPDGYTGTMLLAKKLNEMRSAAARLNYLYDDLFSDLKEKFNGNMFDQDLEAEKHSIKSAHLEKLLLFLGGDNVGSGQRTLGFWAYNFKMIPVETISAIYQDFLSAEDPDKQKKRGAYYTPRFLAEMVVDIAMGGKPDAFNWSYLDLACGSGIFLVILFNRLANHWIHTQPSQMQYVKKAQALKDILDRQIWGIDIEPTACRITCFSLYLAYLDFFNPPEIRAYIKKTGKPLPKLLVYKDEESQIQADIPVIYEADFLTGGAWDEKVYNCIIGNPPYEGRGSKLLALKFLEKAPRHIEPGGTGCLLLPTKILTNRTDTFQSEWLLKVSLNKVLQLADYRRLLFQDAITPVMITRFTNEPPELNKHLVEFTAPKFNRVGLRQGIITISASTRTWIPLTEILSSAKTKTAPVVWKSHLWGTNRDQKFLDLLRSLPPLEAHVDVLSELKRKRLERSKRWTAGEGIKPWSNKKSVKKSDRALIPIKWPLDTPFIETTPWNSDLILFTNEATTVKKRLRKQQYLTDVLYSQPPSDLFHPPMVLINRGFSKVAYSDFNVLFQNSLQSISGPREDTNLLMFLTAYLRSNLARYFLFHTAANWGTERNKVHLYELLRVPFPLPENEFVSPSAEKIIKQVVQKFDELGDALHDTQRKLNTEDKRHSLFNKDRTAIKKEWDQKRKKLIDKAQTEFNLLIYRYFDLTAQEITLVEDTINVFEPSSTPSIWQSTQTVTLDPLEKTKVEPYATEGLAAYADTLTMTLNSWAEKEGSNYRVRAEGGMDTETGLAMVTVLLSSEESAFQKKSYSGSLSKVIENLFKHASKIEGKLSFERDVFLFQGDKIHIVRPNILFNWTRTAALNDAAKIYDEITMTQGE